MIRLETTRIAFSLLLFTLLITNLFQRAAGQSGSPADYTPLNFRVGPSEIYGRFYQTSDTVPRPLVILLHGFPGREGDVLELGRGLTESGIHAYTFNFRGSWRSEGLITLENSLEDVIAAVDFLKSEKIFRKFQIDTSRIVLLGYSYGSSLALRGSLSCPAVRKVITIALTDWSVFSKLLESDLAFRQAHQASLDRTMADSGVIRSVGGKAIHQYIISHQTEWDLVQQADMLKQKEILLIGGWQDTLTPVEDHIIPLYRALRKNGAENVKIIVYDTDHSLRTVQPQLLTDIIDWIRN